MSHMPFDQDTESPEPPSSSVLTGWLVLGVATQLSHRPLDQDTKSLEPPPSSVLSGWLVLGVATQVPHFPLDLRSNRCTGPADLQGSLYFLNHGHLSLQELVEELLCKPRDTWKVVGLYLMLEVVKCVSLTPEECRGSTVCLLLIKATGLGNTTSTSTILSILGGSRPSFWIVELCR